MNEGLGFARLAPDADERFQLLRRELGVTTFGINLIALPPGGCGRIHRHRSQEEVFLVLEGRLDLIVDDTTHEAVEGDLVRVAPDLRRQLVNRGPGRLVVLALGGARPHEGRDGEAFETWDSADPRAPQDIPLPADLPQDRLRPA